jgi:probable F420-dependent oxidoreductase
MPEVRFGVSLGLHPVRPQPREAMLALVGEAERLGFDSLWVGDHIAFWTPHLDSLTTLAVSAGLTERITLGVGVFLLPLRHPALVAKAVATLDWLSGGRVIFGVGVGGEGKKEFEACGVPIAERGRRTDEGIAVLRELWSKSPASFDGRFVRFQEVVLEPKPAQPSGPPIWIGGRSDAALRRAGRRGDGWISYLVRPARFRDSLAKIRAFAEEAGRPLPPAFGQGHLAFVCLGRTYEAAVAVATETLSLQYNQPFAGLVEKYCLVGTPAQCREQVAGFLEAGVRHLVFRPVCEAGQEAEQLRRLAAEIVPTFREPPGA